MGVRNSSALGQHGQEGEGHSVHSNGGRSTVCVLHLLVLRLLVFHLLIQPRVKQDFVRL